MKSLKDFKDTGKTFVFSVILILCILTNANFMMLAQGVTTTNPTITANATICPFMLLTPSFLETDFGTRAIFKGFDEAKLEPSLQARWQVIRNGTSENIDIHVEKYMGSTLLPNLTLFINQAKFDDEGFYRFQVRIQDGWCSSTKVELRKVRGILQYGEACDLTRECNERISLICSEKHKKCFCDPSYAYAHERKCLSQSLLKAVFTSSNISSTSMAVNWKDPLQGANLIQEYFLEISENNGSFSVNKSVNRDNQYLTDAHFVPGHLFYAKITSIVYLNDVEKTIYIKSEVLHLVVEPLPPGAINRNRSNFHPEQVHLHWGLPLLNTSVSNYQVTLNGNLRFSIGNFIDWTLRLEPGTKYNVTIQAISWYSFNYEKRSVLYTEEITTIRTPKVILSLSPFYQIPYLTNLKANASIQLQSHFPPILEVKWQKIRGTTADDIDITLSRLQGSTVDSSNPQLQISRVTFENDNAYSYRCLARNSEGWGTSYNRTLSLIGSLKYYASCNHSRECLYLSSMICESGKCLCNSQKYQRNSRCFPRSYLEGQTIGLKSFSCGFGAGFEIQWKQPSRDQDLVKGYEVSWREQTISYEKRSGTDFVGMETKYKSPCTLKLQPGRMYWTTVRTLAELQNPKENIFVEESSKYIILDPTQPGAIIRSQSNFSADHLYLKWEKSSTSFVNRYKVTVGDQTQYTRGYVPEIQWNSLLMPLTVYKVTITAISYGYTINYPTYGSKESPPSVNSIQTADIKYSGKIYLPYGDDDYILKGKKTSEPLKSPITVYVGDGSDDGFNSVVIGSNGVIGLGDKFNSPNIQELDSSKLSGERILCPFWTVLHSVGKVGKVYYNTYSRGPKANEFDVMFMEQADNIIETHFKDFGNFKASWLVKVTWENMTVNGMKKEEKVTFQCYLISDGDNTFVVYNYVDVNLQPKKNRKISVGYRYNDIIVQNPFSNKNGVFRMTVMPGNRGVRGLWIYKMTEGVRAKRDARACQLWYNYNRDSKMREQLLANEIECPCDTRFIRFDPRFAISRFDRKNRILCFASVLVDDNAECCFKMYANTENLGPLERSMPLAGTTLQFSPFLDQHKYINYDFNPKRVCCSTHQCDLYYYVRPIPRCYRRSPFAPAGMFGDPHITTLDGKLYTFNGYGEYTLLKINTSTTTFELQARTELAAAQNGGKSNATVFSAFVARDQTGTNMQVEMSHDKKSMVIKANGRDLTKQFENANYTLLTANVSIRWDGEKISALFLKPLITVKISIEKRLLLCETLVNKKYKGLTSGLMGNFDDIESNDFMLPNGTELDENATKTERDVFYNFGQHWSVKDSSLFQYEDGLTFKDFFHPEFVPMFVDEVDESLLNNAKSKCGPRPSPSCVTDYLATGDIELALSSGKSEEKAKKNTAELENETPQISGNTTINVQVNQTAEIRFNISDDGQADPLYVILKKPDNFVLDNQTGIATWTPTNDSVSEIQLLAEDDMGVQSPVLDVFVNMCSGCSNHGNCDFDNLLSSEENKYRKVACDCDPGYFGDNCENETDACLESPCSLDRECTDLSPEEESVLGRGFNCSACPPGYDEIDDDCFDIDECLMADGNNCNVSVETCENTEGGYICQCLPGFKKTDNHCKDINECLIGTSGCEQICQNTPGSFTCSCYSGFTLQSDERSCEKAADSEPCKGFDKNCEYTCSNKTGTVKCECPLGYQLAVNGISCRDVNECELSTSPCEHGCVNTEGSFNCTCRPGYFLNEDKTSCTGCELPNYGQNCSKVCECGPGGDKCDVAVGCVCLSGWTGEKCDVDIDECTTDPFICGSNQICQNLEGSYSCSCGDGFALVDNKCEDIDECADLGLNDCPMSTTVCRNTHGNYSCECQKGFQMKNGACEDINECETGVHGCSQMCINVDGGFNCACYFGFTLRDDRESCEKVKDTCARFPGLNCSYACRQQGLDPESGICFCESGYQLDGDGSTCIDINECSNNNQCVHNCTNTDGSFACGCAIGYRLQNDGISCEACDEHFYGENCETPCKCGRGAQTCHQINGCVCELGWTGETCELDVNECLTSPCQGDHELCLNTPGSYRCDCTPGFNKSNDQCIDIDECQDSTICPQKCVNTEGSYACACNDGYKLKNEKDCEDIDECQQAKCHDCENLPGSFRCFCRDGFILNATTLMDCHNIDECSDGSNACSHHAICTDTIGSYTCKCPDKGFKGDGHECTACEDYTYGEQCTQTCTCNTSYTETCDGSSGVCTCMTGWEGRDCDVDVDECKRGTKECEDTELQVCVNTPGSVHCECRYGGIDLNNCIEPKPAHTTSDMETKVKVEARFETNIGRQEFLADSEKFVEEYEKSLNAFYKEENVNGFSSVKVLSVRFGSLIIDYEIIGSVNNSDSFKTDLAKCMTQLLSGKTNITVLQQTQVILTITIKDQSGLQLTSLSPSASPCYVLKSFGASCSSGKKCIDSSGVATCVKDSSDEDSSMFLIYLGVSIPLTLIVIAMLGCWIYHQKTANQVQVISLRDPDVQKINVRKEIPKRNFFDDSEAYGSFFGQVEWPSKK